MSFQVYEGSLFYEIIIRHAVQSGPCKLHVLTNMPLLLTKNTLQYFLDIMNYLGEFLPAIVEVCNPVWTLTSAKAGWTCRCEYQELYKSEGQHQV